MRKGTKGKGGEKGAKIRRDSAPPWKTTDEDARRAKKPAARPSRPPQAERKAALDAARLLPRLLESSPVGIVVYKATGQCVAANAAAAEIIGATLDQVLMQNFTTLESWKRSGLLAAAQEALDRGVETHVEVFVRTTFGKQLWMESRLSPFKSKGRTHLLLIIADSTERRRMEAERAQTVRAQEAARVEREAAATLRGFLDAITESALLIDREGTVLAANETTARRLGTTADRLVGANIYQAIGPEAAENRRPHVAKVFETGEPELFVDERAGMILEHHLYPVKGADGKVEKLAVVGYNIAEHKRLEERLRRAVEELERSNRDLEQFASVASHDLQEPLRMVTEFLGLIESRHGGQLGEKGRALVGYAIEGARRMQQLVGDLLEYSRVASKEVRRGPFETARAFKEALFNLDAAVRESGAVVTAGALPTLHADGPRLAQLFQNLVGNAIKFRGDEPPRVRVEAKRTGAEWLFSVRDNGIGIPPEGRKRLFQVFQRLHSREEYPGTGIGLAICKKIVERHGGRIWYESEEGKGTTFWFTLPAATPT